MNKQVKCLRKNRRAYQDFIRKKFVFDSKARIIVETVWSSSGYKVTAAWQVTKTEELKGIATYPFRRTKTDNYNVNWFLENSVYQQLDDYYSAVDKESTTVEQNKTE